jgi:hypothetical protein
MTAFGALGWEEMLSLKGGSYGGKLDSGYPTLESAATEARVLNAAETNPFLQAIFVDALSTIPEGWGRITAEQLKGRIWWLG